MFGAEDRFLNWFAETSSRLGVFPLLNDGQALVQPVFANDVAKAILEIIFVSCFSLSLTCSVDLFVSWQAHDQHQGCDFQLAGPAEYSYKELAEFVSDVTLCDTTLVDVPVASANLLGRVTEQFPAPFLTRDMVQQMLVDNVAKADPTLRTFADLDMVPQSLDRVAFDYLSRFRRGGHFRIVEGYH